MPRKGGGKYAKLAATHIRQERRQHAASKQGVVIDHELFAQSPALAMAQALPHMLGDNKPQQISLADKFISSTYEWAKEFDFNAHEVKRSLPVVAAYRQAMRKAHRFVLDNDFVHYATEVSNVTPPEKLLYRLQFATLPYDTVWIEFDLHIKVRSMRAFHGMPVEPLEGTAQYLGLLLERVDDTMSTVTLVAEHNFDNRYITMPNLSGYIFTIDDRVLRIDRSYNGLTSYNMPQRLTTLLADKRFEDLKNLPGIEDVGTRIAHGSLWGYGESAHGIIGSTVDLVDHVRVPDFLVHHGQTAFSRFYDYFELARRVPSKVMSQVIGSEITEFSGMMRWVVCVLAMLNEVPIDTHHVHPDQQVRLGMTKRMSAFDYHTVTLRLPKLKPVQYIQRKLSNVERHHRAHEVRGHWRTYLNQPCCAREEHNWEYDYNEGYRLCGKCMSFSRFIHEHVRGDEKLGFGRKDYVLKRDRQA